MQGGKKTAATKRKNLKAVAYEVADGIVAVTPFFLRALDASTLKVLCRAANGAKSGIWGEEFPHADPMAIRKRSPRLRKLNRASNVIKRHALRLKMVIA